MYDVYGLGNALVDTEFQVEDSFLTRHGVTKGHMTLVDQDRINALVAALHGSPPERVSGGSAANSLIAVQGFGGRTFYSCRLADDEVGRHFLRDLEAAGVVTNDNAAARPEEGQSGQCLVLVTPDAERSMSTFLGISTELSPAQIDEAALAGSRYFYAEGYMAASPLSLEAAVACRELAERSNVKTVISLSDPTMVEFFRDNLSRILGNGVDHLFCNEQEALTWAGTDRLDIAVRELKDIGKALNVTLGKAGSIAATADGEKLVPGYTVKAIDTVGAGDMYAGACLYGWSAGMDPAQAAAFGNYAAAQLVRAIGARLRTLDGYREIHRGFRDTPAPAG